VSVQVDIAVAKFKAINRAKEAIEKRERDLDRLIARMGKNECELFAERIRKING